MSGAHTGKNSKKKARERRTDWKRLRSMTEPQIRARIARDRGIIPTTPEFWANAKVVMPRPKGIVTMRLDSDLLDWFRRHRGYQTRINAVLRAYMTTQVHQR